MLSWTWTIWSFYTYQITSLSPSNLSPICPYSMFSVEMYIVCIKSPFLVAKLFESKIFNGNPTTFIPSSGNLILRSYLMLSLYHAITKYSSMSMRCPNVIFMSYYTSYVSMHCPIVIYMSIIYFIYVHTSIQMWSIWIKYTSYVSMHCPIMIHKNPIYFIYVNALPKCDIYESSLLHLCPCASQLWSIGVQYTSYVSMHYPNVIYENLVYFIHVLPNCDP